MSTNASSGQESGGRTDLEITVLDGEGAGVVNVHNPESDRAHSVMLDDEGHALRCSCKGHKFNDGCYHTDEVERRPLIVASARAAASSPTPRVATDGGTATEARTESRRDHSPCERCGDRSWFSKKALRYPSRNRHRVEHVCGLCYALCHRQRWFTGPDGHNRKVPGRWDGDAPAVENQRAVALAARTEAGTGEVQPRETPTGREVVGR